MAFMGFPQEQYPGFNQNPPPPGVNPADWQPFSSTPRPQTQAGQPSQTGTQSNGFMPGLPTPGGSVPRPPPSSIGQMGQQQGGAPVGFRPASDFQGANFGDPNPALQQQFLPAQQPSQAMRDQFLPDVFSQPFLQGLQAAGTTGSFAGQALPDAANFQQGLYSSTLNPMEQSFMQSSGYLGQLGLEQAMNNIGNQYSTTPFASSKNKAYTDAANQFAAQMMNTGSQLGLDRQKLAAQNLPNVFNQPLQSAAAGQESAAGYYNALEKGMYGDLDLPFSMWSGYPIKGSTFIQPAPQQGGK